jgi:cell division initiation protein
MIDLTPLDVRKKRGDFSNKLRGYDPQEVDSFLEDVAARLEELVKENIRLQDRTEMLEERVQASDGREKAVQEALVTAQELRADVKKQATREADLIEREARARIDNLVAEAERHLKDRMGALEELERQRSKFLKAFRMLLEREMDGVEVEEARAPLEDVTVELDLGGAWASASEAVEADEIEDEADDLDDRDEDGDEDRDEDGDEDEDEDEASSDDEISSGNEEPTEDEDSTEAKAADSTDKTAQWLYDLDESNEGSA